MQCRRREARDIRARSWLGREEHISTKISSGMWGAVAMTRDGVDEGGWAKVRGDGGSVVLETTAGYRAGQSCEQEYILS